MFLKLIVLVNNLTLVSLVEELPYEPKCHLESPHELGGKTTIILTPWPRGTADRHLMLYSTSILTMTDATKDIENAYLKKIGKTKEELTAEQNRVMLMEDESEPPDYPPESEFLGENPTDFY